MLLNMVAYGSANTGHPAVPLPESFPAMLKELGY